MANLNLTSPKNLRKKLSVGTTLFFLTGCAIAPIDQCPPLEIPSQWQSQSENGDMTNETPCSIAWWELLNDPILTSLLERATLQNIDLSLAANRIISARLQQKGGQMALYPHLDATATGGGIQYNQKTLNKALGLKSSSTKHSSKNRQVGFFEAGFDAKWEIDLFGMQEHENNALAANIEAAEFDYYHIQLILSSEIGKHYVELRGLQHQLILIEENRDSRKDHLELVKGLGHVGFSNDTDVLRAELALSLLASQQIELSTQINQKIFHLSVLLGYAPGQLYSELSPLTPLPSLPHDMHVGAPSELLRRRPDILKAERDLMAATERVNSSIAALFPRLSITGFIGDIASLCAGSLSWFAAPQILLPIFNSQSLEKDVDFSKLEVQQAFFNYQKIVLEALEEAETAMSSFNNEKKKKEQLATTHQSLEKIFLSTKQLYERGFNNYLDVLASQREITEAKKNSLQNEVELLIEYISLCKALGGGW